MTGRPSMTTSCGTTSGVVHRRAERDQSPTIVSDYGKPVVAELSHQPHDIAGHGALARLGMARRVRRKRRFTISAQVRSYYEVMFSQSGRDLMPGRVSGDGREAARRAADTPVPDP